MQVTLSFQSSGTIPGDGRPVRMVGASMTIGRSADNDLMLADPSKMVSKRHCVLQNMGGDVTVVDYSSNGTFLNYEAARLGPTPTPLKDGDILIVGSYELSVSITAAVGTGQIDGLALPPQMDRLADPLADVQTGSIARAPDQLHDPLGEEDHLSALLNSAPSRDSFESVSRASTADMGARAGELLPDDLDLDDLFGDAKTADVVTMRQDNPFAEDAFDPPRVQQDNMIPDDWDDLISPPDTPDTPAQQDPFQAPKSTQQPYVAPAVSPPQPTLQPDTTTTARQPLPDPIAMKVARAGTATGGSQADMAAMRAFLKGAGMDEMSIDPHEVPQTMQEIGQVFRVLVEGVRDALLARSSVKSEFRIETTMIASKGNNPLKFAITPEMALESLIKPKRGFQNPAEAAREGIEDVQAHEMAMVKGMEAALKGVLTQLAPQQLEGRIAATGAFGSMLKGRKARYWEAYEQLYADIAEQAEQNFNELFASEFARAYQAQLKLLKSDRHQGG
jgi:type VI secretion system protein